MHYIFQGEKEIPPNNPPSFSSCGGPGRKQYFADINGTTTNVTWTIPTATDPEDGSVTYVLNNSQWFIRVVLSEVIFKYFGNIY